MTDGRIGDSEFSEGARKCQRILGNLITTHRIYSSIKLPNLPRGGFGFVRAEAPDPYAFSFDLEAAQLPEGSWILQDGRTRKAEG